jgi:GH15 family glucan-1,4-alpha-glucosidase
VIGGLETAARLAQELDHPDVAVRWKQAAERMRNGLDALYHPDGYFRKGFLLQEDGSLDYDDTLDASSFYGIFMYSGLPLDDPRLLSTAQKVEERLLRSAPVGGVIRYEHDGYFLSKQQYGGNPWVVCTLWLAQYYIATGQREKAQELIQWALERRMPSGALSEQFDPETGFGVGVTPLVWSHAELVNTILDFAKSKK